MRRQIGDALHDDVLQELYAARLDLAGAGEDAEASHRARVAVDAAARQLRDAVGDLHPAVSWTHGLESRLRAVLEQGGERAGFGTASTFDGARVGRDRRARDRAAARARAERGQARRRDVRRRRRPRRTRTARRSRSPTTGAA